MFVAFHIDTAAAEGNFLTFQAKALFDSVIAAKFDLAAGAKNAVPGHTDGGMQGSGDQSGAAAEASGATDRTVGGNFAAGNGTDQVKNFLPSLFGCGVSFLCGHEKSGGCALFE